MNFIVLSSSRGTTFQAVIDAMEGGSLHATCLGLITDSPTRGCIEKAKAANLPVKIVEKQKNESREEYEKRLDAAIDELNSQPATRNQQLVLAAMGWMWILTSDFVSKHTILNVHPALLPKYGGEGMYGHHVHDAVLANNEKESGISIHVMDGGVDTGKILLQKTCPVEANDTAERLQARVQELEKEWYPKLLQMIEDGSVTV